MGVKFSFGGGGGLSEVIPFTTIPVSTHTIEIPLSGVTREKAIILLSLRTLKASTLQAFDATLNDIGAGGYYGAMSYMTDGANIATLETLTTDTITDFLQGPAVNAVADTFGVYEVEIYKTLLTGNRRLVNVKGAFPWAGGRAYRQIGTFAMGNTADWDNFKIFTRGGEYFHTDSGYRVLQL